MVSALVIDFLAQQSVHVEVVPTNPCWNIMHWTHGCTWYPSRACHPNFPISFYMQVPTPAALSNGKRMANNKYQKKVTSLFT